MQSENLSGYNGICVRWKWLNFIDWLLPIYIVSSFPLFYMGLQLDFLFKGLGILTTVLYVIRFGKIKGQTVSLFNIFILLVSFSFIQYLYNGRPPVLYFSDASNYIAAMLFFFIGASDDRPGRTFYTKFAYATAAIFFIGLLCYVTMPGWFLARTLDVINTYASVQYDEATVSEIMRFGAFWGDSYYVSHLSVFCVAIAIFDLGYRKDKRKLLALVCLAIGLLSSIASMHRASMAGSALALVVYFYYNHITGLKKNNVVLILSGVIIILCFFAVISNVTERVGDIFDMITNRVDDNMSVEKALKERKFTEQVMASMRFFIFGHGLGAGGVEARSYGFPGISDMQYIKMFFENGIVGAFLFINIMVRSLMRGFKNIRFYLTEVSIILFILVAMLGSNSLSIYYMIVFPFWYAVGRINNNEYYKIVKTKGWI